MFDTQVCAGRLPRFFFAPDTEGVNAAAVEAAAPDAETSTDASSAQDAEKAEETVLTGGKPEGESESPAEGEQDAGKEETSEPEVPEKYDIQVPEGFEADESALEAFTPLFQEKKFTNEEVQKFADHYAQLQKAQLEKQAEAFEETQKQWLEDIKADKELGGSAFEKSVKHAQGAIRKFGDETLIQALNDTGMGNHPALVRFAARVGKALGEDVVEGQQPAASTQPRSRAETMFPSMNKDG